MNPFFSRLKFAATHPAEASMLAFARLFPGWLFARYTRLARRQGFKRAWFVLSFDCDTDLDIEVVESVHTRLAQVGIAPVYAVPGELLQRGADTYRRLAQEGAEFLNHGYTTHAHFHPETHSYTSEFFYHQLTREQVREDIQKGHQAQIEILGKKPAGFRAPHFGTFQKPDQLAFQHQALADLGYRYSSSTVPWFGFQHGPAVPTRAGVLELPLSGCYDYPLNILDSWGFRYDVSRTRSASDFVVQFNKMLNTFQQPGSAGLFNIYADPSQVYDWPEFFECMVSASSLAAPSYQHVLDNLS